MATTITSVNGNSQKLDGGSMFGNAPRAMWEKWITPDEQSRIPLACRAMLLEFDGLKVLCETGIGAFFEPKLAERFGVQEPSKHMLRQHLEELNTPHDSIDYVILSHLHFDHAGGLLPTYDEIQKGQDELLFSKAQYIVGAEALARAEAPHYRDRASFIPNLAKKLRDTGRLQVIENLKPPKEFNDRIEFIETHGHTPGQLHTLFKGHDHKVFFCGDLVPGSQWVNLPITMGYDRYAEKVIDEKAQIYERALAENWLMFFTHDPIYSASHVVKNEKGRFTPHQPTEKFTHSQI